MYIILDKRDKDREKSRESDDRKERKRGRNNVNNGNTMSHVAPPSRYNEDSPPPVKSSFIARPLVDEEEKFSPTQNANRTGAAIAPPPSLQEEVTINPEILKSSNISATIPYGSSSVAAKIMAKYGFKDGQGLGKQEQGMSMALQVEKTSKRGGRIIHEKELIMPPPPMPPPPQPIVPAEPKAEPSITEIMKAPSKVVLLRVSY